VRYFVGGALVGLVLGAALMFAFGYWASQFL
jgi:uncharacterized membrane protein